MKENPGTGVRGPSSVVGSSAIRVVRPAFTDCLGAHPDVLVVVVGPLPARAVAVVPPTTVIPVPAVTIVVTIAMTIAVSMTIVAIVVAVAHPVAVAHAMAHAMSTTPIGLTGFHATGPDARSSRRVAP